VIQPLKNTHAVFYLLHNFYSCTSACSTTTKFLPCPLHSPQKQHRCNFWDWWLNRLSNHKHRADIWNKYKQMKLIQGYANINEHSKNLEGWIIPMAQEKYYSWKMHRSMNATRQVKHILQTALTVRTVFIHELSISRCS